MKLTSSIIHKEHINYKRTFIITRFQTINHLSKQGYHYDNEESGNFKTNTKGEDHSEGKNYLEKETYGINELVKLRNNPEKKKEQFEKDINAYENLADKNKEKVTKYEGIQVKAEDTFDDLRHYINIEEQKKNKKERNENKNKNERNKDCNKKLKRRSGNWK